VPRQSGRIELRKRQHVLGLPGGEARGHGHESDGGTGATSAQPAPSA
jgi:hypothetical protein